MHPVGRRHHDRVDVLVLLREHVAVVLVHLDIVSVALEEGPRALLLELPDVADAAHPHAGDAHERGGKHLALGAEADHRHVDRVVLGADRDVVRVEDVEARQKRGRHGGALHEVPAVEFHRLSLLS